MQIRRYRPADNAALVRLHAAARRLPERIAAGGQAWVADAGDMLPGYASLSPVPGLPGVSEFDCYVAPERRRQGVASALLRHGIHMAGQMEIAQLSHAVSSLSSEAAYFLRAHDFYLEHEEWQLERGALGQLSPLSLPEGCSFQTFARRKAINRFRALYAQSFGATPWYQPYTAGEVAAELAKATDLLFLFCAGVAVGFVWARLEGGEIGVIEPLGIAPAYQRRGYGRLLLQAALHQLARQGARRVQLGLWRRNRAALNLYRSAGFEHTDTRYYLALDLQPSA